MKERWEYYVVPGDPTHEKSGGKVLADLNALGGQGWQAVAAHGNQFRTTGILMKRQLPDA